MTDVSTATGINIEIERLRDVIKSINTLEGVFRTQRAQLQKLGMSLPPGTLAGLQQTRAELDTLLNEQQASYTELFRLRHVSRTAELINSTLDLDDILNEVMDTVIFLTRAERGYLVLKNPDTGELEFKIARNIEHRTLEGSELIVSRTVVAEVANTGEPVLTTNAERDPRFEHEKSIVNYALRSILCVPLMVNRVVTGVIYTDNRVRQGLFGPKEMEILQTFASQAAVAIENARLYASLQANIAAITAMRDLLSNVFGSISSGVITTDPEGRVTQINDAARRLLNLSGDCLGQPIHEVWSIITREMLSLITEESAQETVELDTEIPGLGELSLSLRLSPLYDSQGQTQGVAIVVDDLTETKKRAAQLNVVRRYLPPAMVDNIQSIDRLALGGERRQVTTVYIDVRDATSFPASMSPQEFMTTLNRYLTLAADALSKQNGVIDKYMANEIMGLFNSQLNPMEEDHSWRALHAVLDMAEEYVQFYRQIGEPPATRYFRVGLHTGVATLGNVGGENRREFTALGDSINLAHRLLENARLGEIVVSAETFDACRERMMQVAPQFHVGEPEQLHVKGRREPIWVRRITRP